MGGGGGSSWNPFENVSWSKPFGDSTVGQIGGAIQEKMPGIKEIRDITRDVNFTPADNTPKVGTAKPTPGTYVAPSLSATTPQSNRGAGPTYLNNDVERAFREQYLKSLSPNTSFNINAETNPFKAIGIPQTSINKPGK